MITEDYVSFEVAKLLKEKGFDEYGMYFYTLKDDGREGYKSNKRLGEFAHNSNPDLKDRAVSCPTQQMAMKWLREKHKLHCSVVLKDVTEDTYVYSIADLGDDRHWIRGEYLEYDSYEEACEDAIKYCLEKLI